MRVFHLCAQKDTLAQRIVLIGDAGQLTDGRHPVVDAVRTFIPLDNKTTILFLGDNLYKNGLPDAQASNYEQNLLIHTSFWIRDIKINLKMNSCTDLFN